MDPGHVIDVDNLHRHYDSRGRPDFEAVRGISLSVRRGELFALLGTNGSGKSSTMEIPEGLAWRSAGHRTASRVALWPTARDLAA